MREALGTSSPSTCCASLPCKSWRPSCASTHVPPLTWSYPTQQVLIHSCAHCMCYPWHSLKLQRHANLHCEAYIPCPPPPQILPPPPPPLSPRGFLASFPSSCASGKWAMQDVDCCVCVRILCYTPRNQNTLVGMTVMRGARPWVGGPP